MRLFFSLSTFALTMILALIVFTYTVINYPSTMHEMYQVAGSVLDRVKMLNLPDRYMVWLDIFLQPNQIVLVGISIAVRFVIEMIGSMIGLGRANGPGSRPQSPSGSPFSRWG